MIFFYYKDNSLFGNARYKKKIIFDLGNLVTECEKSFKKEPIFIHYTINPPFEVAVGAQLQDLENGLYVTKPFVTHIQSLEWQFEEKPIFTMANENVLCPKCNYYMKIKLKNNTDQFFWSCKSKCNGTREAFNYNEEDKEFEVFRVLAFNGNTLDYASRKNITNPRHENTNKIKTKKVVQRSILDKKLQDFEWSVRTENCFKNQNIIFVSDLIKKYEYELLRIPNFGRKSLMEVRKFLDLYDLKLGTSNNTWEINDDFHNDLSVQENIELGFSSSNPQERFDHLYFASKQGSSKAMFEIAMIYGFDEKSLNILANYDESKRWLLKAADNGSTDAYFELAKNASINDKNNIEAIRWLKLLVDNEESEHLKGDASCMLGEIYALGENGVEKSYLEALKYYQLSSDLGNVLAHYYLGEFYYYGRGVDVDYSNAFKFFELAYQEKFLPAYELLAVCYESGHGVSKDLEKGQQIIGEKDQLKQEIDLAEFNPNLFIRLSDYEWSIRTNNCFENSKILYVGDLIQFTSQELLRIPNFGRKSLEEVNQFLSSLDLELGITLEEWPPGNLSELSERYSPNQKLINTTDLVTLLNNKTIKDNISEYLDTIPEKDKIIIESRGGLNQKPKTLDFIGQFFGVTRERIRQLESKIIKKINKNFLIFSKLTDELIHLINETSEPVSISSLQEKFSFFSDLTDNLDFYIYILSKVITTQKSETKLYIIDIDGSFYLTRFDKKEYEAINLKISKQITLLSNKKAPREEVEKIFTNLPPYLSEYIVPIKNNYLSSCLFEENSVGEEFIVKFSKRKSAGLAALEVMLDSISELNGEEILQLVHLKYPGVYEDRNILNQILNHKVYSFSHGTFGMIKHLPFNNEELKVLVDEIKVEINKKIGSEYHSREILPFLSPYFSQNINDFKLTALIRYYELDNYLGRNMFGPPNSRRTKIFDVIVSVLQEEGRRMHASEILSRVNQIRSVDMKMQIQAKSPIIHLGDNMFVLKK